MPIYIVRWNNPDPAVCLVRARDKTEAATIMDDIHVDPNYCEIKEYKGFLVVNIDLKMKYHSEDVGNSCVPHTVVDDAGECLDEPLLVADLEAETALDILKTCFPHYDDCFGDFVEAKGNPKVNLDAEKIEAGCKKALQEDFDYMERKIRDKLEPAPKGPLEQAEDILRQTKD